MARFSIAPLLAYARRTAPPFVVITGFVVAGVGALFAGLSVPGPMGLVVGLAIPIAAVYAAEYGSFPGPHEWRSPFVAVGIGIVGAAAMTGVPVVFVLLPALAVWAVLGLGFGLVDVRSKGALRTILVVMAAAAYVAVAVWDVKVYQPQFMATDVALGLSDPEGGQVLGQVYGIVAPAFGLAAAAALEWRHRRSAVRTERDRVEQALPAGGVGSEQQGSGAVRR